MHPNASVRQYSGQTEALAATPKQDDNAVQQILSHHDMIQKYPPSETNQIFDFLILNIPSNIYLCRSFSSLVPCCLYFTIIFESEIIKANTNTFQEFNKFIGLAFVHMTVQSKCSSLEIGTTSPGMPRFQVLWWADGSDFFTLPIVIKGYDGWLSITVRMIFNLDIICPSFTKRC